MVATVVVPELHVPPVVVSLKALVEPIQTATTPVIALGIGLTVTTLIFMHPERLYVIIAVPFDTPATTPEALPIVATIALLLLHVPPASASDKVVVDPAQTVEEPVMLAGCAFTLITLVTYAPVLFVKVITVVPGDIPVTTPEVMPTVATAVLLLVHDTPGEASVTFMVEPTHTIDGPIIAPGSGFTVIVTAL